MAQLSSSYHVGWLLALSLLFFVARPVEARSIIKLPNAHPNYSVEFSPHLVLDWAGAPGHHAEGMGAGFRIAIPIVESGPIKTINNNMAIGFGLDWSHASRPCGPNPRDTFHDCDLDSYWFPVVLQWNFFLTDVISVFGEPGLAFAHHRWDDRWERCWSPGYCDGSETRLRPVFWGGGRFLLSDDFGFVVRLGFPSVTAGITVLL